MNEKQSKEKKQPKKKKMFKPQNKKTTISNK